MYTAGEERKQKGKGGTGSRRGRRWKRKAASFFSRAERAPPRIGGARINGPAQGGRTAQAEEAAPPLGLLVVEPLRVRLEHLGQEVAVAVLVLAPVLEVLKQRVELLVGVALQVAVDGDVAPVADLLAQVGGVDDELGLEEGVLAVLRG